MKDILADYMSKRLGEINIEEIKTHPGPVITISRLAGCSSQRLSIELASALNKKRSKDKWSVISKEVLHESASKLELNPKNIKTVFKTTERNVLKDILQAFLNNDYNLERKMKKTVINVIKRFAVDGYKIILGRGANIICSDIESALHVRIVGPVDWRIKRIMKSKNSSREEAISYIENTEKDRHNFRKSIKGKKVDCEDYDLTINQAKYSNKEIIEIILTALKSKGLI